MQLLDYFRLTWSFLRWLLVMIILALGSLTAPIVYPFAYLLRQPLRISQEIPYLKYVTMILYIYLDDEDYEVPPSWWLTAKGLSLDTTWSRFWSAYRWNAFRNTVWNFHLLTELGHDFKEKVYCYGLLRKNFKYLYADVFSFAVLKYVDIDGNYSDNNGVFLSAKHSYLGSMFTIYRIEGSKALYWRFSYAGRTKLLGWIEIQLGTTDKRFTARFKIKGDERVFEDRELIKSIF